MAAQDEDLGPIDVVVIGFPPDAPKTGEAIPIFLDLVNRQIIRVFDVRFVVKNEDGSFSGVEIADLNVAEAGDLAAFNGAGTGLLSDEDVALAAAEIEPGTTAVMIVYENRWAAPFVGAVRRSGGRLVASERIQVQDLIDALDAAEASA
jgi:hypothetical protein